LFPLYLAATSVPEEEGLEKFYVCEVKKYQGNGKSSNVF
jgi:hypothetical protein